MNLFLKKKFRLLSLLAILFFVFVFGLTEIEGKDVAISLRRGIDFGEESTQDIQQNKSESIVSHHYVTDRVKNKYSSTAVYFILSGILVIITILSTYLIRECIVDRIRRKSDSFLQTVMDTVFRQAACIFVSLAVSYCMLTSRLVDHLRNFCENLMADYSNQSIINNLATQLDKAIVNNSKVWTAENLEREFNNILAIVILSFAWYCVFVLYFTGCVKFLEKWIRYADETDVGVLIKSIFNLQNLFSLKLKKYSDSNFVKEENQKNKSNLFESKEKLFGESEILPHNSVPITVLNENESISSHKKSSGFSIDNQTDKTHEGSGKSNDEARKASTRNNSNITEESFGDSMESSNSGESSDEGSENEGIGSDTDVEEELGLSQLNESIELDINKSLPLKGKQHRESSIIRRKKNDLEVEKLTWKEKLKIKLENLWTKFWLWPNQLFLTYTKAHFISLRYDFMDEVATYDNYGSSFSTNHSGDSGYSDDGVSTSWLISLTDPTTSLVAGVYFTEYLRAKLLIMAVTLIRIPITTLTFILALNVLGWFLIYDYYQNLILFNNAKHYISEPMICIYISVLLLCFSLTIWLRAWLIKRQLQPRNILEYLKMKYSLDIGMPLQEIEYDKIMPRYKISNTKIMSKSEYSQISSQSNHSVDQEQEAIQNKSCFGRLSKYLKLKLCGTNSPSLHDDLFLFKRNGPAILLRWFQASYFLQLILISIVIHLSYLQKKLWYEEFPLATFTIWVIFGIQHLCLPFIIYPILLCTSVGQMADKIVLEQVLNIQKTQNIQRLSQISEALRFYSFLHLFNSGSEENKELQRRKFSIVAKTAPWELQIRCRNTMNFLINNAPIRTRVSYSILLNL